MFDYLRVKCLYYILDRHTLTIYIFQFSTPRRYQEAVEYYHKLMVIAETDPEMKERLRRNEEFSFAVCVCLANIPGKEDEAAQAFERAHRAHGLPYKDELVARAHMSRMFRRAGRIAEAEEHELQAAYV